MNKTSSYFFDSNFEAHEQLPREFTVHFETLSDSSLRKTVVSINGIPRGDVIDDNSWKEDGYRFHDVFHYTFAALLGWSPCTRSMIKRKRKSNPSIDRIEDGARATITEEAISLLLFDRAKQRDLFRACSVLDSDLLDQIKSMTSSFEVNIRTREDWQEAILRAYSLFRSLVDNDGGKIHFDMNKRLSVYEQ